MAISNTAAIGSRRSILKNAACGFGYLALQALLSDSASSSETKASHGPLTARAPHFAPRAKRVIFLYMSGGPSQMDTFDYKPKLQKDHGKQLPGGVPKLQKEIGRRLGTLLGSPFKWSQHGESGLWASELFPHVCRHIDRLCVVRSMHTEGFDHANATLVMNTGTSSFIRPSMGSWVTYGLGSENGSLPGFVTICPDRTRGSRNHSCGFLPAVHQGTVIGHDGISPAEATIRHLQNSRLNASEQRRQLDFIRNLNQQEPVTDPQLEGMVQSLELGFRMQQEVPKVLDLADEPQHILKMYGVNGQETDDFARQCLMARQLSEAGVRFVQLTHTIRRRHNKITNWDQHTYLEEGLRLNCKSVDQPIAALLTDLQQRGLLDDTLVLWGGEFGRTSVVEYRGKSSGRDHNPLGFTMWLAGGGVKGGMAYGETDDYGYRAIENKVHVHDLHATLLHLLGLDHTKLTYRHTGRDFRLTDVHGNVVKELLA